MTLIDCLLMTLPSAVICICLPKVLMLIGSIITRQRLEASTDSTAPSRPKFSEPTAYPELTSIPN